MVTLAAGASQVVEFNWDTTTSKLGEHVLKAQASVVEGETDTADNSMTATVTVVDKKTLYVDVTTDQVTYFTGDTVLITVEVTENIADGTPVKGASVHVTILTQGKFTYGGDGTTDDNGIVQWSFKIKRPDGTGLFTVIADASKEGYDPGSGSTTFEVQ